MNNADESAHVRMEVEMPSLLDFAEAHEKYTQPLRQLLDEHAVGTVVSVRDGEPNTVDEFSIFLEIELFDYETGLDVIAEFLANNNAPDCTMITSYEPSGEKRDIFILRPGNEE